MRDLDEVGGHVQRILPGDEHEVTGAPGVESKDEDNILAGKHTEIVVILDMTSQEYFCYTRVLFNCHFLDYFTTSTSYHSEISDYTNK